MRRRLVASLVGIVVIAILGVVINFALGNAPSLGLDLQGGASVTLQPDGDYDSEALDVATDVIRQRVDSLGVAEPEIVRQGDTIVVNLPGVKDQRRAIELVGRTGAVQLRPVLQVLPGADTESTSSTTTVPGATTTSEAVTSTTSAATSTTGTTQPGQTTTTGGTTTTTEAATVTTTSDDPDQQAILPDGNGNLYVLGPAGGTGEVFSRNSATADIVNGQWVVTVGLRGGAEGEGVWNSLAQLCYVGNPSQTECPTGQLAIVLDGTVISAPTVNEQNFSGNVEISGKFTEREARDLAKILKFGAVPVKLDPASAQVVSATLGDEALRAVLISAAVGIFLLLLYLFLYYRLLTIVIACGLIVSFMLTWSVIAFLGATRGLSLTLSGCAGLLVSVGVTVDSYVVYFERLKDELRSGRTLRSSAKRGFEGAWHTILVADLVSLLGAGVLWYLTVGSVRGFAFFLGLATLIDIIVAYFFTRPAIQLLAQSRRFQGAAALGMTGSAPEPAPPATAGGVA